MGSNDLYEIRDLVMIGILKAKGVLPASVAKDTSGPRPRIAFYFKDDAELRDDNVQDIVRKKNAHNIVQSHISFCLNDYPLDWF